MARLLFKKYKSSGFTLVELLIVVAIIGVLSTIGVPTFRRMVQKSKKSEAKVNLGGLYTAQAAFFAEYGGYGNNLDKIGFEVDGAQSSLMYTVGFPTDTCKSQTTALPAIAGPIGININTLYPAYYSTFNVAIPTVVADGLSTVAGNTQLTICTNAKANLTAPEVVNVYNNTGDADAFVAVATGVIAPGISKTAPGAAEIDVWRINNKRVVINTQDGVR